VFYVLANYYSNRLPLDNKEAPKLIKSEQINKNMVYLTFDVELDDDFLAKIVRLFHKRGYKVLRWTTYDVSSSDK
jgi:peptidoglycan/xylan/chitin deacetylase (PgdA/CDA1 family)